MVKTLTKSVREYKKQSILTPIFMVLEVIFECLIPLFMSRLIDEIEGAGNNLTMRPILINGGILVGLAACSLISGFLAGRFAATASCGFAKNLRQDLFYKVQGFSFGDVDKFSSSSLDVYKRQMYSGRIRFLREKNRRAALFCCGGGRIVLQ